MDDPQQSQLYTGIAGIVLFLYVSKALVLRFVHTDVLARLLFVAAVALCVPLTWAISVDWDNSEVSRIANYVGYPVSILTVPCVSFLFDLRRRQRGAVMPGGCGYWRMPLELLVVVPLWIVFWIYFETFILGWISL
jgi:hypothetical protein